MLNPHLSRTLFVARAGDWLRAAGQLGQSQTDAGETGQLASCCQEHVQADGQSAQQDALLQRKRSCSCASYIHLIQPNWKYWSEKQRDSHSDGLLTDVGLINVYKNPELTQGEYEFALCLSIHSFHTSILLCTVKLVRVCFFVFVFETLVWWLLSAWWHADADRVWREVEALARGGGALLAGQLVRQQPAPGDHLQGRLSLRHPLPCTRHLKWSVASHTPGR